jgi:hypothetical protein
MHKLSEYFNGNRIAVIYQRDQGFWIMCLDVYTEQQEESYSDSLELAEIKAEDWVFNG